jgi:low temperature requirement protein LtrA
MAALLVAALSVPTAFDDDALVFAAAYAVVRVAHIVLYVLASAGDPMLRRSVQGLAGSTAVGVGLITAASLTDGVLQGALWATALLLDMAGPYFIRAEGWKLAPRHFAERHGLVVIIALGESIVVLGVGAELGLDLGVVTAATLGIALSAVLWWLYFDVVSHVAERRLVDAAVGREQNEIARDSYSYLHFPMVAGIVLVAVAMKKTLADVGDPLDTVPAVALLGGVAAYLLAHVAFRWRNVHRLSKERLVAAAVAVALVPLATELSALWTLALVVLLLTLLIVYETVRFGEEREYVRQELARGHEEAEEEREEER